MEDSRHKEALAALRVRKSPAARFCALTAYDAPTARLLHAQKIDMLFVGDSVGTNILGYESEREVTLDDIRHHVAAVRRGAPDAVILADLPWSTYPTPSDAVENAKPLMAAGASLVKIEGPDQCKSVEALVAAGIPVCAHLGFTPQTLGHPGEKARVQAKSVDAALALVSAAQQLEAAGASFLVLELVPDIVAAAVTRRLKVPTIGIGAGPDCDAQVLIVHDVLGLSGLDLRLAKKYADGRGVFGAAVGDFRRDVLNGRFPAPQNTFHMDADAAGAFARALGI